MARSVKTTVSAIREDKRYRKLKKIFDTEKLYSIPFEELTAEITSIHDLREIRRLNTREAGFVDKVVKANTHDQAQRSRLVAIMMRCVHVERKLEDALEGLKHHLLLEYSDHLRQYRTKEERLQVLHMVLRSFRTYLAKVTTVKELAELVISDIDRGAWSLKATISAMEISSKREMQV